MKLDRNLDDSAGRGKYALLLLRKFENYERGTFREVAPNIVRAIRALEKAGLLDWGTAGTESEFFLIRLKDLHAQAALTAYANDAEKHDTEWAAEVREMALRSGPAHPNCKRPD